MSGVFRCTRCNYVDHMDIVYFLGNDRDVDNRPINLLCTVCHGLPWHDRMLRLKYNPEIHEVVNPPPELIQT